jgi:hypothetical protein
MLHERKPFEDFCITWCRWEVMMRLSLETCEEYSFKSSGIL